MASKEPMDDPRMLWQNQPGGGKTMLTPAELDRRSRLLLVAARRDMLSAVGTVAVLLLLPRWILPVKLGLWYDWAEIATAAWAFAVLLLFRKRLWPGPPPPAALGASGIVHFREQLADRRDELRRGWLWRGPAVVALLLCVVPFAFVALGQRGSLQAMVPFLTLSVVWLVMLAFQTIRQVRQIDREIESLEAGR